MLYKTERKCHLNDIAVPGDKRIELKEQEKIDNYRELIRKVKRSETCLKLWLFQIGTLGVESKRLKDWLKRLYVKSSIELLQKAALLRTAKIVWQVQET